MKKYNLNKGNRKFLREKFNVSMSQLSHILNNPKNRNSERNELIRKYAKAFSNINNKKLC